MSPWPWLFPTSQEEKEARGEILHFKKEGIPVTSFKFIPSLFWILLWFDIEFCDLK
jgi:hypothetical protein